MLADIPRRSVVIRKVTCDCEQLEVAGARVSSSYRVLDWVKREAERGGAVVCDGM
jgi:hypothetical protein